MWLTKKGLKSGTQTFGATRPSAWPLGCISWARPCAELAGWMSSLMAHHHHQVGLDLLRGTGWETEAPHGAQLDISGLGLIDSQSQPSIPWSWPLRGVAGRGHTILDSLVGFPCPGLFSCPSRGMGPYPCGSSFPGVPGNQNSGSFSPRG